MSMTRRQALASAGAAALASSLAKPAIALNEPIRLGYLPALTGPSPPPASGINRGVHFAVEEINAAGGVNGRQIEVITRDTQGDPTKAVNASAELISGRRWRRLGAGQFRRVARDHAADGARRTCPQVHPCGVDSLIDPKKYPNASASRRPTCRWAAVRPLCVDILKARRSPSSATPPATAPPGQRLCADSQGRARRRLSRHVDATKPDVTPDVLRMQYAGAEVIVPWSVTAGMLARMLNARGAIGWDVPFVGQPALGSGEIKALLEKPAYWEKVYPINYRRSAMTPPASFRREPGLRRQAQRQDRNRRHLLWWIALGYDASHLSPRRSRRPDRPEQIIGY